MLVGGAPLIWIVASGVAAVASVPARTKQPGTVTVDTPGPNQRLLQSTLAAKLTVVEGKDSDIFGATTDAPVIVVSAPKVAGSVCGPWNVTAPLNRIMLVAVASSGLATTMTPRIVEPAAKVTWFGASIRMTPS